MVGNNSVSSQLGYLKIKTGTAVGGMFTNPQNMYGQTNGIGNVDSNLVRDLVITGVLDAGDTIAKNSILSGISVLEKIA